MKQGTILFIGIVIVVVAMLLSLVGCSQAYHCSKCNAENYITKDTTIVSYKDSTINIPYRFAVPHDSVVYYFTDTAFTSGFKAGKIASITITKQGHNYTAQADCKAQWISDSIMYTLRIKTLKEVQITKDRTAENNLKVSEQKIKTGRWIIASVSLIALIFLALFVYKK